MRFSLKTVDSFKWVWIFLEHRVFQNKAVIVVLTSSSRSISLLAFCWQKCWYVIGQHCHDYYIWTCIWQSLDLVKPNSVPAPSDVRPLWQGCQAQAPQLPYSGMLEFAKSHLIFFEEIKIFQTQTGRRIEGETRQRAAVSVVTVVASMFTACNGERSWGRTFSGSATAEAAAAGAASQNNIIHRSHTPDFPLKCGGLWNQFSVGAVVILVVYSNRPPIETANVDICEIREGFKKNKTEICPMMR